MGSLDVYAIEWAALDVVDDDADEDDDGKFEIRMYGRTDDDKTACVRVSFPPYFFVKTPGWSQARQRMFLHESVTQYGADEAFSLPVKRKDAWGYSGGKLEDFVQLAFPSNRRARIAKSRLAKQKNMEIYEASVDPVIRMCHVRNISPSGWVRVKGYAVVDDDEQRIAPRCDVEVRVAFTGIGPPDTEMPRPRLVLCSWVRLAARAGAASACTTSAGGIVVLVAVASVLHGQDGHERSRGEKPVHMNSP